MNSSSRIKDHYMKHVEWYFFFKKNQHFAGVIGRSLPQTPIFHPQLLPKLGFEKMREYPFSVKRKYTGSFVRSRSHQSTSKYHLALIDQLFTWLRIKATCQFTHFAPDLEHLVCRPLLTQNRFITGCSGLLIDSDIDSLGCQSSKGWYLFGDCLKPFPITMSGKHKRKVSCPCFSHMCIPYCLTYYTQFVPGEVMYIGLGVVNSLDLMSAFARLRVLCLMSARLRLVACPH